MPAVTVDDLTVLPRLTEPGPAATTRPVAQVTSAPQGYEGEGFPVRRAFAGVDLSQLDPFIHLDRWGKSSMRRVSQRAPRGTHIAVSRP